VNPVFAAVREEIARRFPEALLEFPEGLRADCDGDIVVDVFFVDRKDEFSDLTLDLTEGLLWAEGFYNVVFVAHSTEETLRYYPGKKSVCFAHLFDLSSSCLVCQSDVRLEAVTCVWDKCMFSKQIWSALRTGARVSAQSYLFDWEVLEQIQMFAPYEQDEIVTTQGSQADAYLEAA